MSAYEDRYIVAILKEALRKPKKKKQNQGRKKGEGEDNFNPILDYTSNTISTIYNTDNKNKKRERGRETSES